METNPSDGDRKGSTVKLNKRQSTLRIAGDNLSLPIVRPLLLMWKQEKLSILFVDILCPQGNMFISFNLYSRWDHPHF
jgi:hypothetical protein